MRNLVLFFVLLPQAVLAAEVVRCGTDDFGNTVCMDKDGVVTAAPQPGASVPSAGPAADNKQAVGRVRCGIDPFGNRVCR